MSNLNWSKDADRQRMQRQGAEDRADTSSKNALRRQADRLLAGYTGPVTKVPAGSRVIGSQVSGEIPRSVTGNISSQATFRSKRTPKARKQTELFGTASKSVPNRNAFDRSVPPGLVIYCDGACEPNPGQGGWGFVVYRDGREINCHAGGDEKATNQRMELTAAIEALYWASRNIGAEPFRLLSDSAYTVNGSNDWRHGWKAKGWRRKGDTASAANQAIANLDLWQELDRMLTVIPIKLEWCKGHVGIIGNERADELSLIGRAEAMQAGPATAADLIEQQLDYSARIA